MSDQTIPKPDFLPDDSRCVLRGRKFDVYQATLPPSSPDGKAHVRELVVHSGAVVILPLLEDGRIVMIRNNRWSVQETLWELPAGTLEPPEPPDECAKRELIEETGYEAKVVHPLIQFYTSPGFCTELIHCFTATGLIHVGQQLEETEDIQVEPMSVNRVLDMIKAGEIRDAKTVAAILHHQLITR